MLANNALQLSTANVQSSAIYHWSLPPELRFPIS